MLSFAGVFCRNCIQYAVCERVTISAAAVIFVYCRIQLGTVRAVVSVEHFVRGKNFACIAIAAKMNACLCESIDNIAIDWECLEEFERDYFTVTDHTNRNQTAWYRVSIKEHRAVTAQSSTTATFYAV